MMEVPMGALFLFLFALPMLFLLLRVLYYGKLPEPQEEEEEIVVAYPRAAPTTVPAYPPVVRVQPRPSAPPTIRLGYFPFSAEGRRASEKLVCAICLEVFVPGQMCSEVPACRHLFHRDCIYLWMKNEITCPLCRANVLKGRRRPPV